MERNVAPIKGLRFYGMPYIGVCGGGSMYTAQTPVLSKADAEDVGRFLARYAIQIAGLRVYHITADGKRIEDNPTADAIKETATSGGASAVMSEGLIAAGVSFVLPPAAIIAAVAAIPALLKKQNELRKAQPGGKVGSKAVMSELSFDLANVSARRRKWSEYLLSIYAARHDWRLTGLHHLDQLAAGARYAASHASDPPPWGERTQPPTWAERSAPQPTERTTTTTAESRTRRALRDLW